MDGDIVADTKRRTAGITAPVLHTRLLYEQTAFQYLKIYFFSVVFIAILYKLKL